MWNAPDPAWNQTVPGFDERNIKTAVMQVLNGSTNVLVKWSYTLLDKQRMGLVNFRIEEKTIGAVASNGASFMGDNFINRFNIESTSEFSSLTINTVTESENTTFQCQVVLIDNTKWAYSIRIEVTGMKSMTFDSECNLIVRKVSSI